MTTNENHRGRLFAAVAVPGGRTSALLVYTLSHAAVDLACGYILYSMYRAGAMPVGRTVLLFLLYNTLAFGLQIVFGAVCDRFGGCRLTAVLGCLSTAIGVTVGSSAPVLAVLLVGVGNAAFHTGGGCDTLLHTDGMTGSGIFVSSGALGLAIGARLGSLEAFPAYAVAVMLLFAAVSIAVFCGDTYSDGTPAPVFRTAPQKPVGRGKLRIPYLEGTAAAVAVCIFAITVRSYTGFAAPSPGFSGKFAFIYVPFCAFAGKLAGGVLSDLIGARRVGVISLLLSAPLFLLGADRGIFFLAAVFFFNFAMPITLCTVARRLVGHEGFAFGLNTLALLVGYIVSRAALPITAAKIAAAVLTLLAAAAVAVTADNALPTHGDAACTEKE